MKKNKLMGVALSVLLLMNLSACSNKGGQKINNDPSIDSKTETTVGLNDTQKESESTEKITLRLAHSQAPDHLINSTADEFAKLVNEQSNGTITIDVYPSETLGTSAEMADATSSGDVDFYIASTGQYTQRYKPFSIIEAFYMFRDTDHLLKFYESDAFETLKDGLAEQCNVHILAPVYYGSRQMTTKKIALNTPEDFAGIKMRAANEPMPIAAIQALGGSPTPVAYNETYLALQQGVVDGQENPPMSILAMKFYEVQDYLNITNHQYQMMNIFMSDAGKKKLSEEQLQILYDVAKTVSEEHNEKALEAEQKAVEELGDHLEIVNPDTAAFAEKIKPMYDGFKKDWIEGMVEEIQAIK